MFLICRKTEGLFRNKLARAQKLAGTLVPTFGSYCCRWHVIKSELGYFLAAVA